MFRHKELKGPDCIEFQNIKQTVIQAANIPKLVTPNL